MKAKKVFSSLLVSCLLLIGAPLKAEPHVVDETYSVVVLGGGIGALTSSIYLARAGYKPLVIEGEQPGGAIALSHSVQNWPGEIDISGDELMDRVHKQAETNGVTFLQEKVVNVDFSSTTLLIETEDLIDKSKHRQLKARACIIALGAEPRFLKVEGERLYWNRGVYHCAVCDGALFKGKDVAVIGGGDTAILEAEYLANLAQKVHLILRSSEFRTVEKERLNHLLARPNVETHYRTSVEEILGDGENMTGLLLQREENLSTLGIDGVFLAIGSNPSSALFKEQLDLDEKGYIKIQEGQETSKENVFAIGDVSDPVYKQAISAAGDGAKAAMRVERRLNLLFAGLNASTVHISSSPVVEIKSAQQFEQELKDAKMPVVVDFYATWCPPCKRLAPQFEEAAKKHAGKIKFLKVNIDECQDLSETYNIRAIPTVVYFDSEGTVQEQKSGYYEIIALLEKLASS